MKRICVFCGSSKGLKEEYIKSANQLAKVFVNRGIELVYGGASVGIMGELAKTVKNTGGKVIGIMPESIFNKEVAYKDLSDLRIVKSMHERKALMNDLSDGFIALPGGYGTFEEFLEVLTWAQLGFHKKPCGILNIEGFYDKFIEFIDYAVCQQFLMKENRDMIIIENNPEDLIKQFKFYIPPTADKAEWALNNK